MSNSLYNQTFPVMVKYLNNLSHILDKADEFCKDNGRTPDEIIQFRLIEDMRSLDYQVQSCSNTAKFTAVRVGGIEDVFLEDNEKTFDELRARIKRTIEILDAVDAEAVNRKQDEPIIMATKMGNFKFASGQAYVSEYAIPNFHFHLTSAYCILRHLGVKLGAFDYLKDVFHKE